MGVGTIGLLAFGAYQVMKPVELNPMTAGTFFAFFTFVGMLYPTVGELMSGFSKLAKSTASIDRVFELLESEKPEETVPNIGIAEVRSGAITFENVHFGYEDGGSVLRDVSVKIPAGKVVAITGPSGAGKSTLVSLLPRFNDPDRGAVIIDGLDTREYDIRKLRKGVGIAFQECFLFNSSVLENLRYARPDATLEQIVELGMVTGAHDVIRKLPKGYETLIGDAGLSLSRGEKQRLALTRALLKQPRILILDEATASIDALSEAKVVPAVLNLMKGRTILMITHRPEMLRHADMVVQLIEGRVVYQGPPADAMVDLMSGNLDPEDSADIERRQPENEKRNRRQDTGTWPALPALLLAATLMFASIANAAPEQPAEQQQPQAQAQASPENDQKEQQQSKRNNGKQDRQQNRPPKIDPAAPSNAIFEPMPGFSEVELEEALEIVTTRARAVLTYDRATPEQADQLPATPAGIRVVRTLVKPTEQGKSFIQIGYRQFRSQPIHVWLFGQVRREDGSTGPNPELNELHDYLDNAHVNRDARLERMLASQLASDPVKLSYIDSANALGILKSMGFTTIEFTAKGKSFDDSPLIEPTSKIDPKQLPIVMSMPDTKNADLVGGDHEKLKSNAPDLPPTSTAPLMQLMVFYDPGKPEQFAELLHTIRTSIDVPARQILIEAMVLEISETGLDQLGVEWTLESPQANLAALTAGRTPTFNARNNERPILTATLTDVFGTFNVQLETLIRRGEAEILSRPSVLTLDNRQARIEVGEEIPVATTISGLQAGDKLSFNFEYIPVGIFLNVRPRISSTADEVSLQIVGNVSAQVPGQDLVIFDTEGQELARAPRLSKRRVQTYSRIANNTPFIIGGLISKDITKTVDKVPLLGDIPLIKHAFRSTREDTLKREVIIVITPYILPEDQIVGRNLPKDEDQFDSFGHRLFRDAYRIRDEDVFDLAFIIENPQLQKIKDVVSLALQRDAALAEIRPFEHFVGESFPGEDILVLRQMYEVIKRREIDTRVAPDKIIFFKPDEENPSNFDVRFLAPFLAQSTGTDLADQGDPLAPVFEGMKGKALALTYTLRPEGNISEVMRQPVPEVRWLDCPDGDTWDRLLWEYNQPDEDGHERSTIIIRNQRDISRLARAMVLKRTVAINASNRVLQLEDFSIGRLLLMPAMKEDQVLLIDEETARYFFYTEQYYPALQHRLEQDTKLLIEALDKLEHDDLIPPDMR